MQERRMITKFMMEWKIGHWWDLMNFSWNLLIYFRFSASPNCFVRER
jgi:hypothetical protein